MNSNESFHLHFSSDQIKYDFTFLEKDTATSETVVINGRYFSIEGDFKQIEWIRSKIPELESKSSVTLQEIKDRLSILDVNDIEISSVNKTHLIGVESLISGELEKTEIFKKMRLQVENSFRPMTQNPQDPSRVNILDRMKELNIPGASLSIIVGGEIAWSKGYGIMEDLNKYAQVASISKTVNALTMISLIDKGHPKLNERGLETDVREILGTELMDIIDPEGLSKIEGQQITIKRLLSHTAGISTPVYPGYQNKDEMKNEIAELQKELEVKDNPNADQIKLKIEYLKKACSFRDLQRLPTCEAILTNDSNIYSEKVKLIGPPGKFWEYSGGGAEIIQRVIEVLTGKEYEVVVKEQVFDKLDMWHSSYAPDNSLKFYGYGRDGKPIPGKWHDHPELAAAGLWSTASDLAKLAIGIQKSAFEPEDKRAVISSTLGNEMWTPLANTPDGEEQHGLGVFLKKGEHTTYAYHTGDNNGYRSVFFINEEGDGAAVVVPSENGDTLMKEAIASISEVYQWKDRNELLYIRPMFAPHEFDIEGAKRLFDDFRGEYHLLDNRSNEHTILISGNYEQIQITIDGDKTELVPVSNKLGYFRILEPNSNQYSARVLRPPGLSPGHEEKAIFEEEVGMKSVTIFGDKKHTFTL